MRAAFQIGVLLVVAPAAIVLRGLRGAVEEADKIGEAALCLAMTTQLPEWALARWRKR